MTAVEAVRARLAELCAQLGIPAERTADGDLAVPHGSTTVHLQVSVVDGVAVIDVWAPVALDVAITPALHRFVAETSFMFGRLVVEPTGAGVGQVVLGHVLVGDPLTEEVVLQVLGAIANTADGLDEEIVAAHGGRRATDPSTEEQP